MGDEHPFSSNRVAGAHFDTGVCVCSGRGTLDVGLLYLTQDAAVSVRWSASVTDWVEVSPRNRFRFGRKRWACAWAYCWLDMERVTKTTDGLRCVLS
jgi:hypothetical protein